MSAAQAKRRTRGMTLVEVLISLAILVTGLTIIFAMMVAGVRSHKMARNYIEATTIASSIMAEARGEFFRDKVPPSELTFRDWPDDPRYEYNMRVVAIDEPKSNVSALPREYFVRVEVRWSEQGERKKVGVDSVMFRNLKGR